MVGVAARPSVVRCASIHTPFYRSTSNVIRVDINTTDTLDNREVTSISFQDLA